MEERIKLLAQQVATMTADVTTIQSELAGSGAQLADHRIKRIIEASDDTATLVSKVQALEAKSTGATTTSRVRFRWKEASDFKPNVWTSEKTTESCCRTGSEPCMTACQGS